MAYFNEIYLQEAGVSWHGKKFLSKEELSDPKFRKEQLDKLYEIIKNGLDSEAFAKEFTDFTGNDKPAILKYNEDADGDDAQVLEDFLNRRCKALCIFGFSKEKKESGAAEDCANFFIKAFEKAKKDNKDIFGRLKYSETLYSASLDYVL